MLFISSVPDYDLQIPEKWKNINNARRNTYLKSIHPHRFVRAYAADEERDIEIMSMITTAEMILSIRMSTKEIFIGTKLTK